MALTLLPEDTSDLNAVRRMDYRFSCGHRRSIDVYDEPTVATCIAHDCEKFLVIPENAIRDDIEEYDTEDAARNRYDELK